MTLGAHYLNETAVKVIITIPIASGSVDAWIEYVLTMLDGRINQRCFIATNTTDTMNKAALASVEFNAFLKVMQNTRLSREGVPAEIQFINAYFSPEDLLIMQDVRDKNKYVARGYARDAVI